MKRELPVIECDLCGKQQVHNGDDTEILGITIGRAFFTGTTGGGPLPKDTFICEDCVFGNEHHGPVTLDVLRALVFHDEQRDGSFNPVSYYS